MSHIFAPEIKIKLQHRILPEGTNRKETQIKMQTSSETATSLNTAPPLTSNNLVDIITWLSAGDYVVVHNQYKVARYFHSKCEGQVCSDEEIQRQLEHCRVLYLDVASLPGLIDDGEWEYYIKEAGHKECTCLLKTRCADANHLPHSFHFSLGF